MPRFNYSTYLKYYNAGICRNEEKMKKTLKVLMVAMLGLCCLAGCGKSDATNNDVEKENPIPTVAETAAPTEVPVKEGEESKTKWKDGFYTSTGTVTPENNYPDEAYDIDVTVEIKEGKIVDVKYAEEFTYDNGNLSYLIWAMDGHHTDTSEKEDGSYQYVSGSRQQIIDAQGIEGVDAVSGATWLSRAIQDSVQTSLVKAEKGEKDPESTPVVKPEKEVKTPDKEGEYTVDATAYGFTLLDTVDVRLTYKDGKMFVVFTTTMSPSSYDYLYMGTDDEAYAAGKDVWLKPVAEVEYVNKKGQTKLGNQYEIPVESLDSEVEFIVHAKSSGNWFYRTLVLDSSTLKEGTAYDIAEGTYSINVESSSSMFKVTKAELVVTGSEMNAVITLSGTGYGKLYLGTGEAAATATEAEYITYVEDADGAYTFTFPVAALDQPLDIAAFSNKKSEWYDRQLTFLSETMVKKLADGVYSIDVTLEGGSGRTTVVSPAKLTIANGVMVATVEWTSPNYDYMLVNGEKYLPVNTEGNSVFEIPVAALDVALDVIGDTVAMSKPKEIEYTLTFHSDSMVVIE